MGWWCGHLLIGGEGQVLVVGRGVGSDASQEEGAEGGEGGGVGSRCLVFMMGNKLFNTLIFIVLNSQ